MKKQAKEAIRTKLRQEQEAIRHKLRDNIRTMKRLVESQTLLKRELAVYDELIRSLQP